MEGSLRACGVAPDESIPVSSCDALISVHSAYYYDFKEISATLWRMPEASSAFLIMHKFVLPEGVTKGSKEDSGTFGHGEVKWQRLLSPYKDSSGQPIYTIEQTDSLSGTTYRHNDNSRWFDTSVWKSGDPVRDNQTGITWDVNLCGPDTYVIQVSRCSASLAWTAEAFAAACEQSIPVFKDKRTEFIATGVIDGKQVCKSPKAFLHCRDSLLGKTKRDDVEWSAHVSRYRRALDKFKESDDDLQSVCLLSFFMDAKDNRDALMVKFCKDRASQQAYVKQARRGKSSGLTDWGLVVGRALMVAATIVDVMASPAHKVASVALKQTARVIEDHA